MGRGSANWDPPSSAKDCSFTTIETLNSSLSPPSQMDVEKGKPNSLHVVFNNTAVNASGISLNQLEIFLMDKAYSPKLYPNELETDGSWITVKRKLEIRNYKIKLSRSEHVEDDPLLDCSAQYTEENSYNDCLQSEINELFTKEIGCVPPLYTPDLDNMCNVKFNLSANTTRYNAISELLLQLVFQNWDSQCKIPCTRSKYTVRYLSKGPWAEAALNLIFDSTVEVTRTRFSINEQTLLTNLGGAISSGQTLLWILVTLLGATQVISYQTS